MRNVEVPDDALRVLRDFEGPIYAATVDAGESQLAGYAQSGASVQSISFAVGRPTVDDDHIVVTTSAGPPWESADMMLLRTVAASLTRPTFPVTFEARHETLAVDGELHRFRVVQAARTFCAVGKLDGRQVQVSGKGRALEDLQLETVAIA